MNTGKVYIFSGDGKGKTSAALGMLLRGLSNGWSVAWISWYKQASWGISEHNVCNILNEETKKRLTFLPMGEGFFIKDEKKHAHVHHAKVLDHATEEQHKQKAEEALIKAEEFLGKVDVLFLDEICNAINDKLILEERVIHLLSKREKTHVILTGRNVTMNLIEFSDLVSSVEKVKHPFDSGELAIKGLDF